MSWDEMTKEILLDTVRINAASPNVKHIAAVVQWNGKTVGRVVFQPSPFDLVTQDNVTGLPGLTKGMSYIPEPPHEWQAVESPLKGTVNGVPSKEDMPLFYYVDNGEGTGVVFAGRFSNGTPGLRWVHTESVIDRIADMLLVAGVLKLKLNREKQ